MGAIEEVCSLRWLARNPPARNKGTQPHPISFAAPIVGEVCSDGKWKSSATLERKTPPLWGGVSVTGLKVLSPSRET